MKKIFLLSGSQRKGSLNLRLLSTLAERIKHLVDLDIVRQGEINFPLFDQDLELNPDIQKTVSNLHSRISNSDALIVASPEYNGLLTPYL
jgi:NAD(P)H-dependent FMN reductase